MMLSQVCRWFLLFLLYSFLGWTAETLFCSIPKGRFVERGFLRGPVCPIYGTGALLVLLLLAPWTGHPVLVFLLGAVLTSVLEYVTSFLMELLFHTRWWDYSNRPWNLNGRICLRNSLLFGVMGLALTLWIHPLFRSLVDRIPPAVLLPLTGALLTLFLLDTVTAILAAVRLRQHLQELRRRVLEKTELLREDLREHRQDLETQMRQRRELLQQRGDLLKEQFELELEELRRRLEEKTPQNTALRRLLRSFPTLRQFRHRDYLLELKRRLKKR